MSIYKKPIGVKRASMMQGIYWAIFGLVAGIYCWQPLLKASHRDESSILADLIQIDDGKATFNFQKEEDESKSDSSS